MQIHSRAALRRNHCICVFRGAHPMKIGVIVPQGWTGEYKGWSANDAWARTRDVAWQAEALGFESIWLFDHFHTVPRPTLEITFEAFTSLAALAAETERVRLGHVVLCSGYRNPALTTKMICTLDAISDGRAELGLGRRLEARRVAGLRLRLPRPARAPGDPQGPARDRPRDDDQDRATYEGKHHSVSQCHQQARARCSSRGYRSWSAATART